jgi:hypothetical protein
MTEAKKIGSRGAALLLAVAGSLSVLGSFLTWGTCPTTPCGGPFQSFSFYSGIDLGFGVVTAVAGLVLAAIGLGALRRQDVSRFATVAVLLALLIVVTAGASVVWMYVIPGEDKYYRWPSVTAILVGIVGLMALAASLWLRRTIPRSGG